MPELQQAARGLIVFGLAVVAVGLLALLAARLGGWPRLPGDILVRRPGMTFYFPLGTCVALSVLLTLISLVIRSLRR